MSDTAKSNREYLDGLLARYPELRKRLAQALLIELHGRGVASIDVIHREAHERRGVPLDRAGAGDDNAPMAQRWDEEEQSVMHAIVLERAAAAFDREELADLVNLTRKREEAQSLQEIANLSAVSFGLLAERVKAFCALPVGRTTLSEEESVATRVALIRQFVSDQLEFLGVAKGYLRIRDFDEVVDHIIGSEEGSGRIGGKGGGLLLGAKILQTEMERDPAAPAVPFAVPETFFLRSDVLEDFLRINGLQHLQDQKYKPSDEVAKDYPMILQLFRNADWPPAVVEGARQILKRVGDHPLIVRSSSLLEDRFGTAFAGKYRSVFVCNQGDADRRLSELLGAVAEVYASTLHPDPISYRRRHGLLDYSENMAVLVQKTAGRRIGGAFLPVWAGVGFSHNPWRRNPRIRPEDGMARLVFGFGTRAVDRVAEEFPRVVPLGLPTLRPEVKPEDVVRVAQKHADVIDLEAERFATLPVGEILAAGAAFPGVSQVFSRFEHGHLRELMGDGLVGEAGDLVVTFDRFAASGRWPAFLRWALRTLERAYGCPVDIEFACDGETFHLLQCRPQVKRRERAPVHLPAAIENERRIFSANRDVITASVHGVEYVVLVDPRDYNSLAGDDRRLAVAQAVHRLNAALAGRRFILMGPGRWGSKDLRMGIRVGYADIDNAAMLIEIARAEGGYVPEVSFGSHFFQDLVESEIHYLPLYPDEPGVVFNDAFLRGGADVLAELLPEAAGLAGVVRVIHVPRAAPGRLLNVDMDGDNQEALAYLAPPED